MKFIELNIPMPEECQVCVSVMSKGNFRVGSSGNQLEKKERKIFIVRVHRDHIEARIKCEKHVEHIFFSNAAKTM